MSLRFLAAAAAAVLIGAAGAAQAQQNDAAFHATTLHLSAIGETKIKPDMAVLNLGVMTEAPTAQAAMQEASAKLNSVLVALRAAGVKADDVQTAGVNLNAQYRYEQNHSPELTGYQASNTVRVTVRDLPRAGAMLDAAVQAGANQVHGISFTVGDPKPLEDAARLEAVRALNAKAELYARATGTRLVRLISLSEGGGGVPQPRYELSEVVVTAARAQPVPVAPGELTVRESVIGVFEVAR